MASASRLQQAAISSGIWVLFLFVKFICPQVLMVRQVLSLLPGVDSLPSERVLHLLGGLLVDSSFVASRPPARRLVSSLENASVSRLLAPTQASLARSKSAATLSAAEGKDPAGNSPEPFSRAASLGVV